VKAALFGKTPRGNEPGQADEKISKNFAKCFAFSRDAVRRSGAGG
jgi:hypothetical protein